MWLKFLNDHHFWVSIFGILISCVFYPCYFYFKEINISSHNRTVPEEEECEEFFNNRMDLAPYYPIGSEGAAVTLGTAVATLYRYFIHI